MRKRKAQVKDERAAEAEAAAARGDFIGVYGHPDAFQVAGPRHVSFPNWRDLIKSKWKEAKHRRKMMACFVQATYLLELDRQGWADDLEVETVLDHSKLITQQLQSLYSHPTSPGSSPPRKKR